MDTTVETTDYIQTMDEDEPISDDHILRDEDSPP